MASADSPAKHYEVLSGPERFALMVEAMARRDDAEADRLEDSCPQRTYRTDEWAFRERMRVASKIAMMACLNMRAGLAQSAWPGRSGSCATTSPPGRCGWWRRRSCSAARMDAGKPEQFQTWTCPTSRRWRKS